MAAEAVTIGSLRERFELQSKATTSDTQGGRAVSGWTTTTTVWAAVQTDGAANEQVEAGALTGTLSFLVTMRHRDGVTPKMRGVWRGQTLQIHSAVPDPHRRWLYLRCSQVQG